MSESIRTATVKKIVKTPTLRNAFIVSLVVAIAIPIFSAFWIIPAFTQQLTASTEDQAVRTATHLMSTIIVGDNDLKKESLSASWIGEIEIVSRDLQLEKLKIFSKSGETLFSTDAKDIGKINEKDYFHNLVAKGDVVTKFVQRDSLSSEGRVVTSDVVETYVPIIHNSTFMGAFEVYYDITDSKEKLDRLMTQTYSLLFGIATILLLAVIVILFKASQGIIERDNASEALKQAHDNLEKRVEERTEELTRTNEILKTEIAERKIAEDALRNSEEQYREMIQTSGDAIISINEKGEIIQWNPAASDLFGYDIGSVMGKHIDLLIPQKYKRSHKEGLNRLIETGKSTILGKVMELEGLHKNGMSIHIELSLSGSKKDSSWIFTGIIRDTTERKQAEEKLRESEEKHRSILASIEDSYFEVNERGEITSYNEAFSNIIGYSPDELMGMKNDKYLDQKNRKNVFKKFNEVWKTEIPIKLFEYEIIRKNGEKRTVQTSASLMTDKNGQKVGFRGIIRDVTAYKLMEKTLQKSEEKYRTVLESNPDPMVVYSTEGKVTYMNPAFTRVFGWSSEERIGKKMDDFVPEETWPETKMMIDKVMAGEHFSGIETRRFTKEGNVIPISISGSFYRDQEGNVSASVINLRDITEQKESEEERSGLELQLQQAQKMEAIGTLAGGIAHDFNNLLMGMQGHTSLMLINTDPSHPHFHHLKGIEDNVESAAGLTRQLLGFARGGKYEVKPTNLNSIIIDSSEIFGRTKKEITIHREVQKELWTVEVDQTQIEQVLLNLYVNAWQAISGTGELHLKTENVTLGESFVKPYDVIPGRYVKISVADTGSGMDKATQQRIFDPFFTTKEKSRGTGLGLASAYGIIRSHGGAIKVYSEIGKGATFNIYLPKSQKEVKKKKEISGEVIKGTETLLLIDDEEIIIEVCGEMLENLGYTVLSEKGGKEATATYQKDQNKIDGVILDMVMPVMGGSETYDRLKAINPDIKVLLSSGYSIDGLAKTILAKGCDGFIQKPFNVKELSQKLRKILGKE